MGGKRSPQTQVGGKKRWAHCKLGGGRKCVHKDVDSVGSAGLGTEIIYLTLSKRYESANHG